MTGRINTVARSLPSSIGAVKSTVAKAVAEGDRETLSEMRARADAMGLYEQRVGAKDKADEFAEIKVRAERGLGQIDLNEHPRGRPVAGKDDSNVNFIAGLREGTRAAWRTIGKLSDKRFEAFLDDLREDEEAIGTEKLIRLIRFGSQGSSTTFECYTPAKYLESARLVLGAIDLDPASAADANEVVGATEYFDLERDGLAEDWYGRVWLNPPYGRSLTRAFVAKAVEEYASRRVSAAIVLLNAYGFDAGWFQPLWDHLLCFTDHRIPFYGGGPTFGSLFVYLGPDRAAFLREFAGFGTIVERAKA